MDTPAPATASTSSIPHALQLIMDSLRYWVTEMHVDGFRFDLASTLARELHDVDRLSAFFDLVQQDPIVSQVKLIAEPWDVGEGGYQVGNFPPLWTEWNGKYRDSHPRLLARERRPAAGVRAAVHRLQRPVRQRRPPPARLDQLRHLPRRFHPARPRRPTTTSTTRPTARTTATATTTTGPGTTAPRARPTTADILAVRDAAEAQPADHAPAVPGRADDLARRRAGPYASRATTTPTARTTS